MIFAQVAFALAILAGGLARFIWQSHNLDEDLREAKRIARDVPDERPFSQFAKDTLTLTAGAQDKAAAAEAVSKEVTKLHDQMAASNTTLDTKATTILGFVGGGASLYTFAIESNASAHPAITPLLFTAVGFLVFSLVSCLACLATRFAGGLPELRTQFAGKGKVLFDDDRVTNARVAAFIAHLQQDRLCCNRPANISKARWIDLAQSAFFFGVVSILANYLLTQASPHPVHHCTVRFASGVFDLTCDNEE